jgi:hypothetical protein
MRRETVGRFLIATWVVLMLVALVPPAWALGPGAPPNITFAAVWVNTFRRDHFPGETNGIPRLVASLDVLIPGGQVPANVASVTVMLPGGGTVFTLTKDVNDLFSPESSYFLDLSGEGVVGFPTGTYTFTVTDTAGGVTVLQDDLGATTGLTPATNVALSGATQISPDLFRANFSSNSTTTVSWTPPAGANSQRVRVRRFSGPDLFNRRIADGTTSSLALPGGIFVPGRVHEILVEAEDVDFLPNSNARGRQTVRLFAEGPEITLSTTGGTGTGQTFTINARVFNSGAPVAVDVLVWVGLPTGQVITLLETSATIGTSTNDAPFFNGPIFTRTFDGSEPSGRYVVGIRFVGPLAETVALQTVTFSR